MACWKKLGKWLIYSTNHISIKFLEFNFNLSYEYVQIYILQLCITLSLKNHTIQYFIYRHMSTMTKHHFAYNLWDFKWLLLDDKSNPYIDVNQISCKLVTG